MTADADNAGRSDPDSAPMDAEDYPETAAGTSHGAGDAETELVPPATAADPAHAWSREDPVTEALSRPWRSVWAIASIGLLCAVIVAFAISGVVALMRENHGATQPSPTTPTQSASAPPPGSPGTPQAARADDDEFVALAISPHAIGTLHLGGFGTSGIQDRANQIALSECRAGTGNDDCLLVNAGMFHGCVSYAIDTSQRTWASGSGVDSDSARANAVSRLGTPASSAFAQCSDPPGIIQAGSPAAAPSSPPAAPSVAQAAPLPPPSAPPAADPGPSAADDAFLAALRRAKINVSDTSEAIFGAHWVCGEMRDGYSHADVITAVKGRNPSLTDLGAIDFVADSVIYYCPQFKG
jgi:hypothetical protein